MSAAEAMQAAPEPVTIQSWLDWWFHHCTRGVIQIGWRDATSGQLNKFRNFAIGADDIGDQIAAINATTGQSCYFRAVTVREGTERGAEDADFVQAPGIWGDLDDAEAYARAGTVEAIIRPSAWVETGKHPHWRAQCFWRLEGICENPAAIAALNRRVVTLYGSDPSVTNPTRLMRLPGTVAWPAKPGRVVEQTRLIMPPGRPQAYDLTFLAARLPQEQTAPQPPPRQAPAGLNIPTSGVTVSAMLAALQAPGKWHESVLRLVGHWIARGWSDAEIYAAGPSLTLPGYTLEQTRRDLAAMINGARKKWGVSDTDHAIRPDPASPFSGDIIDPWDTLKPVRFPQNVLPPLVEDYAMSRAEAIGCDPAAVAMACLSALSAALDGRSRLRMKQHDTWSVPPAIWVALIGPPSAKKSPAIRAAWHPLESIQGKALANYANALREYEALPKDQRADKPRPPLRLVSHDATIEAIQSILAHQDRGLGILRDELSGWIGGMERYSGGKGGADRAFFLQGFEGGGYVADRIGRGTVPLQNLLLTVCGGIQPDKLATLPDLTDDGLWQRFLPVVMAPPSLGKDSPRGAVAEEYAALVARLVGGGSIEGHLTEGARHEREQFEGRLFDVEQSDALGAAFSSFLGKLSGAWGRLALVLHASEGQGIPGAISALHANAASRLVWDYLIPSAARVYLTMGGKAASLEAARDVAGFILVKRLDRLVASDLSRNVRVTRRAPLAEIQRTISPLVAGGWLTPEKEHGGNNAWVVNPLVHEQFAARAATEQGRREHMRRFLSQGDDV